MQQKIICAYILNTFIHQEETGGQIFVKKIIPEKCVFYGPCMLPAINKD